MVENNKTNKVAIVTGGTRGIGRAITESLLAEGFSVAICGVRPTSGDTAVNELRSRGNILGMVADVSKHDDVKRLVAAVQARFGTVHLLVNNAGTASFKS